MALDHGSHLSGCNLAVEFGLTPGTTKLRHPQADFIQPRAVNAAVWKKIFKEDIEVVEGMQSGRHAPLYDGGKFSAIMDTPTHHFHKWVANGMLRSQ